MLNNSRFSWGVTLLVFGFLFLLRKLGVFTPSVDAMIFDWRNIFLVLGITYLVSHKNKSIGAILLLFWALFYLKDIVVWSQHLSDYIWPLLLIAAGVFLIYNGRREGKIEQIEESRHKEPIEESTQEQ